MSERKFNILWWTCAVSIGMFGASNAGSSAAATNAARCLGSSETAKVWLDERKQDNGYLSSPAYAVFGLPGEKFGLWSYSSGVTRKDTIGLRCSDLTQWYERRTQGLTTQVKEN